MDFLRFNSSKIRIFVAWFVWVTNLYCSIILPNLHLERDLTSKTKYTLELRFMRRLHSIVYLGLCKAWQDIWTGPALSLCPYSLCLASTINLIIVLYNIIFINNLYLYNYGRKEKIREASDGGGSVEACWHGLRQLRRRLRRLRRLEWLIWMMNLEPPYRCM